MGWSEQLMARHRATLLLGFLAVLLPANSRSFPQTSVLNSAWSGQAQCKISVQGPGYSHHETHTWTLSGSSPTLQGAIHVFPATWSVSGQGSLRRTQGSQTLNARWTTNGSLPNAPLGLFLRASDGKLVLKSVHAQLRVKGGASGTQQLTINGIPQKPSPISLEAFEWTFPGSEVPGTSRSISGSNTTPTTGAVGPMQPGGSQGTASCSWNFTSASSPKNGGSSSPGK
jgi:hypothetical protein